MCIHRNYLREVTEMQAPRVLVADDGDDEEDEDEDEERQHDHEEEEETVWTSPQRRRPK